MKFDVMLNLIGLVALMSGFVLFLMQQRNIGVGLTLVGIGIYLYNNHTKKN